jgi:hypothetical protein
MVTQTSDAKFSIGWLPRIFCILNWREIDNFIDRRNHNLSFGAPYDQCKQLWTNFCIKIIFSHTTYYHFNTTSDKIYKYKWTLKYFFNSLLSPNKYQPQRRHFGFLAVSPSIYKTLKHILDLLWYANEIIFNRIICQLKFSLCPQFLSPVKSCSTFIMSPDWYITNNLWILSSLTNKKMKLLSETCTNWIRSYYIKRYL